MAAYAKQRAGYEIATWGPPVLFCLSVSDKEQRVILDDDHHGDILAVIEARS